MNNTNEMNQDNLVEKGRLKFFYHYSKSELPIRNVYAKGKNGLKTEPHIEIGVENYWNRCYQDYLQNAIVNNEKYIFWMTTCRNRELPEHKKRMIVGYLVLQESKEIAEDRSFFKGKAHLFSFEDSIQVKDLGYTEFPRKKLVDEENTKKILKHFKDKQNIVEECVKEIKSKDPENKTCHRITKGVDCQFKDECLRWKT